MSAKSPLVLLLGAISVAHSIPVSDLDINRHKENSIHVDKYLKNLHHNQHHTKDHYEIYHHDKDTLSPINIQTLNLIYKLNTLRNRQKQLDKANNDFKAILKQGNDRMCKKEGRCGCSGDRCSSLEENYNRGDSSEVERILDELESELRTGGDRNQELRCRGNRCGGHGRYNYEREERDVESDSNEGETSEERRDDITSEEEYERITRDGDQSNESNNDDDSNDENDLTRNELIGNTGKDSFNLAQLNNHGKSFKMNNDLEAIVLDVHEINDLLNRKPIKNKSNERENLVTVENVNLNDLLGSNGDDTNVDAVVVDLSDVPNGEILANWLQNELLQHSVDKVQNVRPADVINYYSNHKKGLINQAVNYIKDGTGKYNLKNLPLDQKKKSINVKSQVLTSRSRWNDDQIKERVDSALFGQSSSSKVFPHNEQNNYVYVPKWLYKAVQDTIKNEKLKGERQKSMFPVTVQQQSKKIFKVDHRPQKLWRRSYRQDLYGLPFELNVQGLGQVNP